VAPANQVLPEAVSAAERSAPISVEAIFSDFDNTGNDVLNPWLTV